MSASRGAANSINSGDGARTITADAIAALVGGELIGDGATAVTGVAPLDRAGASELSVLSKAKYASELERSRAGIVLIDPEFRDAPSAAGARIIVGNPMEKMLAVLPRLYPPQEQASGIASTARIGKGTSIGANVSIGEYVVIGQGVRIGDHCVLGAHAVVGDGAVLGAHARLHPNVTLYRGTKIGERSIVHSGATIGSDGFGYAFRNGVHEKIPHVGGCVIGSDVEIGAGTTIDRGSIDDTVIGDGTKIDNLVQIAHNVRIGQGCVIVSQAGIAGSAVIEDGCVIGGQAGLGGHITIGRGARIAGQSGVFGDVPAGESWSGYPARPHRESLRATAAVLKLSGWMKRLEKLLDEKAPE